MVPRSISAALDEHYSRIESKYFLACSSDYSTLVTPNGNSGEPVHRWFHFKEAFSHRLLSRVLKDEQLIPQGGHLSLYDPFTGSGTSAVSAAQLVQSRELKSASFLGSESNPYLHLLSSSKLRLFQDPPSDFLTFAGTVVAEALAPRARAAAIPRLSTFRRAEYFESDQLHKLLALKYAIDRCKPSNSDLAALAKVCLASAIEPASSLRRDGRTLRYAPYKVSSDPIKQFVEIAERISEDTPPHSTSMEGKVNLEDSRRSIPRPQDLGAYDLALFSPPYPNNIDYTEVYKLEAWLLGLIKDQVEFTAQRHKTIRSHGSLTWPEQYEFERLYKPESMHGLLTPILDAIPQHNRYAQKRRQLVMGYADDMLQVIRSVNQRLRHGGLMACVVGNSLHGKPGEQILVAADLMIASIAEMCGFEVTRIEVARYPKRRRTSSSFLRESIVFARKKGDVDLA